MNKQIISEINRYREIMGLSIINEAPIGPGPAQRGIEEVLEKLGLKTEKLGTTSVEEIERALSKDASTLDKFEKIGTEFEQGSLQTAERLIDDLISNPAEWKMFVSLVKSSPAVFSEISDKMVKELSGPSYQDFVDVYNQIESKVPGKGSEAVERAADNLGYTNDTNREFWKGWKPKGGIIPNVTTTPLLSAEAKALLGANSILEKSLSKADADLINNLINKMERGGEYSLTKLTQIERIQLDNALKSIGKEIDVIKQKIDKDISMSSGAAKSQLEKTRNNLTIIGDGLNTGIQGVKKVANFKNLVALAGISIFVVGGYITYGFISSICETPILKHFCNKAHENLTDETDKKDEPKTPDDKKEEEKKPEIKKGSLDDL